MQKYNKFVMFSAGPVGDHLVQIDTANHFHETTGLSTVLVMKHPSPFLSDLSTPYRGHIKELSFRGMRGVLSVASLALQSIWEKNCYVLIFPIPLPLYFKFFVCFIRYFTRSRVVGYNLEGSKSFPVGHGYSSLLGKKNTIPMQAETFAVSSSRMLQFLGFTPAPHIPRLGFAEKFEVFGKLNLEQNYQYVVMHITPSHLLRTLPADRWNSIIEELTRKLPDAIFVFTGSKNDIAFIDKSLRNIDKSRYIIAAGKTDAHELMTLYAHARVNVTVQTGNALMIAMLHLPQVVVNIKGTAMFYYDFNEHATILYSKKDCVCDPFETKCNMVTYKGEEYMACVFNIPDNDIINAIVSKYSN